MQTKNKTKSTHMQRNLPLQRNINEQSLYGLKLNQKYVAYFCGQC